jgi:DHA1 family bicyclomycin/chloramphenicol resistance-like MFS transporter
MVMAGALLTTAGLGLLLALDLAGIMGPGIFFGLVITVGLGNGILLPNANAGMLSVRPDLAGTAAGLGGAFAVGGGALFSALAGALLQPGSGPMPLILMMLGCSALPVLSVLWMTRDGRGTPAV